MSAGGVGASGQYSAPISLFLGQSNSEGRDTATGVPPVPPNPVITPDPRVRFYTGAGLQAYPYPNTVAGAHGLYVSQGNGQVLRQQGTGLVYQGLFAQGGTNIGFFTAGGGAGQVQTIVNVLKAAAPQKRTVAFWWQQGENEAQGLGTPATYQADLTTLLAQVQGYFGPDYLIKMFVVMVNPNTPAAPQLATVRAAETAFCAVDPERRILVNQFDGIVPALDGGLHYGNGQTFPMGDVADALTYQALFNR